MTAPRDPQPLSAEEMSLLDRLDADPHGKTRNAIERRITQIAEDPDGRGRELSIDDHGRVHCGGCGRSVFPENWADHLLSQGDHGLRGERRSGRDRRGATS